MLLHLDNNRAERTGRGTEAERCPAGFASGVFLRADIYDNVLYHIKIGRADPRSR